MLSLPDPFSLDIHLPAGKEGRPLPRWGWGWGSMCAHSQPGDRGSRRDAGQCSTPVTQTTFLQQVPASPLPREGLLSGAEVLPCTKPAQPCRNQPPKPHRARDGGRGQQGAGEALLSLSCFWESQEKEKEVDTLRTPKDSRSHGGFLTLRGSQ